MLNKSIEICQVCQGLGQDDGGHICEYCQGTGRVIKLNVNIFLPYVEEMFFNASVDSEALNEFIKSILNEDEENINT